MPFLKLSKVKDSVDWSGRRRRLLWEYGTGETPQALQRRGGSPNRPRKAKPPGMEINS